MCKGNRPTVPGCRMTVDMKLMPVSYVIQRRHIICRSFSCRTI